MKLIKAAKVLILLPVIIFSFLIQNALCDEEFDPHDINDVTFISFGGTTLNIGNLNKALSDNKYLPFSTNALTIGTGTRNISGKIMMGSEGNYTLGNNLSEIKANGYKSYLSSSFNIILNVGYVVYSTDYIKVYPFVGAGVGRVNMDIMKDEKTPTFNEILTKPERGVPVSTTSAVVHLGVGADYLVKLGKSNPQKGGIVIGLKAGYVFSAYTWGFKLENDALTGSPDVNNNGAYVKLYVGYTAGILAALGDLF